MSQLHRKNFPSFSDLLHFFLAAAGNQSFAPRYCTRIIFVQMDVELSTRNSRLWSFLVATRAPTFLSHLVLFLKKNALQSNLCEKEYQFQSIAFTMKFALEISKENEEEGRPIQIAGTSSFLDLNGNSLSPIPKQSTHSSFLDKNMITMRRSKSRLSSSVVASSMNSEIPEAKRQKILSSSTKKKNNERVQQAVKHPRKIAVPSKKSIRSLYNAALVSMTTDYNDQEYLKPAGILSFEQVLLPSIALEEEKVLKKIQAKVQRDAPEYRKLVELSRRLVRQSMVAAMQAVAESRLRREQKQEEQREQQAKERRLEREARAVAAKQAREMSLEQKQREKEAEDANYFRNKKRQYPKNQELFKEVMLLTSSMTKLEKEERMWIQAEQGFISNSQRDEEVKDISEDNPEEQILVIAKDALQQDAEHSMRDIILASTRIQQGLNVVSDIFKESEGVRKELYQSYRKDHQFAGYQGTKNPASLIRFLSQED
jgi:hypothetical protein